MGEVHRARIFAAAGVVKDLCIKRIRSERLTRPGALERFIREARLSMRLTHGNIVPVFDFGRSGDEYYLVMQWVDGTDMAAVLHEARTGTPLPPEVAAYVAAEVARALAYAHESGDDEGRPIVHRDVKPANVLISNSGEVKISDFGMAMVAGDAPDSVGGTPGYMAPEQSRGEAPHPCSDLYALGVLLAEMITGQRPQPGQKDPQGAPSKDTVPQALRSLLGALLSVEVEQRPASAREVANALEQYVAAARASSGHSPRDELAERAKRCRSRAGKQESGELTLETDFLRDGADPDFTDRMTTHATLPDQRSPRDSGPAGPAPQPAEPKRQASPTGRAAPAIALLAGCVLIAWLAASGVDWSFLGTPSAGKQVSEKSGSRAGTGTHSATPVVSIAPARSPDPPSPVRMSTLGDPLGAKAETPAGRPPGAGPTRAKGPASSRASGLDSAAGKRPGRLRPVRARRGQLKQVAAARHEAGASPAARGAAGSQAGMGTTPVPGRLSINAIPWAEVYLGHRKLGVTPLFGLELSPGDHNLRLVNRPLGTERQSRVRIESGRTRNLVVDLR